MIVKTGKKNLLLPYYPGDHYRAYHYGAKPKFHALQELGERRDRLTVCHNCGYVVGHREYWTANENCSKCGNSYHGDYRSEFIAFGWNVMMDMPTVRCIDGVDTAEIELYRYREGKTTTKQRPEKFYTIRYSLAGGVELIPERKEDKLPIHHLKMNHASWEEEHIKELFQIFDEIHPGNGIKELFADARRRRWGFSLKIFIQYFFYMKKYPYLEQLAKAGYGAILYDILRLSPRAVKRKLETLFSNATSEKKIVTLPSFMREFLKTDNGVDDKRFAALQELYLAVPDISREDFELFRKAFPCYLLAMSHITRFIRQGDYTLRELCKLVISQKKILPPREVMSQQRDYIRMCRQMEVPIVKFPANVKELHDDVSACYTFKQNEYKAASFDKRVVEYRETVLSTDKFLIRFPDSLQELIYEGNAMHHCVASYADRVIDGSSIIFFMRRAEDPTTPYITMEFNSQGGLVQARKSHNRAIGNAEESAFIQQFRKEMLLPKLKQAA